VEEEVGRGQNSFSTPVRSVIQNTNLHATLDREPKIVWGDREG